MFFQLTCKQHQLDSQGVAIPSTLEQAMIFFGGAMVTIASMAEQVAIPSTVEQVMTS
jgi:hypothetical protein